MNPLPKDAEAALVFIAPGVLTTIAAGAATTAFAAGLLALIYRAVRRVEATLGVDKHGRTISDRMERVEHQLWPNGGSSLADVVHRTAEATAELRAETRVTRDLLARVIERR